MWTQLGTLSSSTAQAAETSSELVSHQPQCVQPRVVSPPPRDPGAAVHGLLPPALGSPSCSPTAAESPCPCPHPASPKTPVASLCVGSPGAASPALVALLSSPSLSSLPSPPPPLAWLGPARSQVPLVCPVPLFLPSPPSANSQGTLRAPFIHSRHAQRPRLCHGGRSWMIFRRRE